MNENMRAQVVSGLIILILLGGAGYYIYRSNQSVGEAPAAGGLGTTTPVAENGIAVGEPAPGGTAELVAPDLSRPYVAPARLPESIRKESEAKYTAAVASLREDSSRWNAWMEVAVYRKGSDDFKGAEEVWLYVTERWPTDPTAYANLADLYANYLASYEKAEAYYRRAISLKPDNIAMYVNLHDLYRLRYKTGSSAAADVLLEGLARFPKNIDLLYRLGLYYKGLGTAGSIEQAKKYLTDALAAATEAGNASRATSIEEELKGL